MVQVPKSMRKGRTCYKCGTHNNVSYLNYSDGNHYCARCALDVTHDKEDQVSVRIAKATGIAVESGREEMMKARARI